MNESEQIAFVRRICRFEALRAAMLSIGSEVLDDATPSMVVTISQDDECGMMGLSYVVNNANGVAVYGGDL